MPVSELSPHGPLDVCNREMNIRGLMKGTFYMLCILVFCCEMSVQIMKPHGGENAGLCGNLWEVERK